MKKLRNRKTFIFLLVSILIIMLLSMLVGCNTQLNTYFSLAYFGTSINVYGYTTLSLFKTVEKEIDTVLTNLNNCIDLKIEDSDISKLNKSNPGETIEVNKYTYDLFKMAKDVYLDTNGAFDPSVYMLTDLWGFTSRFFNNEYKKEMPYDRDRNEDKSFNLPEEKYINGFKELVDFSSFNSSEANGKYYITKGEKEVEIDGIKYNQKIDFGGIAKGFACDLISGIFEMHRINRGYISIGNSSLSILRDELGRDFTILLTNPRYNGEEDKLQTYCSFTLRNKKISTSGDYERYYTLNGKRYCHIINPKTGYPVDNEMLTVTLIGDSAAKLDAYSTALMILGYKDIENFNFEYSYIYNENNTLFAKSNIDGYKITESSILAGTTK